MHGSDPDLDPDPGGRDAAMLTVRLGLGLAGLLLVALVAVALGLRL